MNKRFRIKLFVVMIIFAIIMSISILTVDYMRLKDSAVQNSMLQLEKIEDTIMSSLTTVEKAYDIFDQETAAQMKQASIELIDFYDQNARIKSWDYRSWKEKLDMDIYVIDFDNVIQASSYKEDVGLDFNTCCTKLVPMLNERRNNKTFHHEGIDVEQDTGRLKKYSYMATRDGQYVFQLGKYLDSDRIYREFDFLKDAKNLVAKYDSVNDIHILNIGGQSLGMPTDNEAMTSQRRQAFEQSLTDNKVIEIEGTWNGEPAFYRYVPYQSRYDNGTTKYKTIEIVYNSEQLNAVLLRYKQIFIVQLILIVAVSIFLSYIISKWVSRPMYLAFHDSLTGLQNRASFADFLIKKQLDQDQLTGFLMIDLDHFKEVNDCIGHDEGDVLLQGVAECIKVNITPNDEAFRFGGDEFLVILTDVTKARAEQTAGRIIRDIRHVIGQNQRLGHLDISASIGIAYAPDHGTTVEELCKKADIAMYKSKQEGKNQSFSFQEGINEIDASDVSSNVTGSES
ncbi:GGDEF domain-containing protein [Lentibacillus saliphilus]|uniref:GGDEF domain-containing protein n=1 Tax=Lentibacillus saliphilus TaxID=2737028 RepID=UPI001C308693|nr:GGDEF domain-containing protein [Lentibacillus saliphilus]